MRILLPREDSNSITHSSGFAAGGAISSTKAGSVRFCIRFGCGLCEPRSRFFGPT
jgi:hypothetical protein